MRTIFKYVLPSLGRVILEMPRGARILSVQNQRERVTLWATVDESMSSENRAFNVVPTGKPLVNSEARPTDPFIGTVLLRGGDFVAHVFEEQS